MQTPSDIQHNNAVALLEADHQAVSKLFKQYEKATETDNKKELVSKICAELSLHAQVEEEIFYPQFKLAVGDKPMIAEAIVEHSTLTDLMAQVEGKQPDGEMFDAKIKVLAEYVQHHVKEEETEMFPKAKKSKMDLEKIGMEIIARKTALKKPKK